MLIKERRKLILPFLLPGLLLYIVFFIYPSIRAFVISFYEWSGFNLPKTFVGLQNYKMLIKDEIFYNSIGTTLIILIIGGFFIFAFAFMFTIILSSKTKTRKIFRAIIFFPNTAAPIALTVFWAFVFNQNYGIVNGILKLVGLKDFIQPWTSPDYLLWTLLTGLIWIYTGFFLVILLAGIDKIPTDYFDAARVDGANPLQMFIKVTIPMMWDVISVALILWMITALKQFEFIYGFKGSATSLSTYTLPIYLYRQGFGGHDPVFHLGYASAIGVALLAIAVFFGIVMRRFLRKENVQY